MFKSLRNQLLFILLGFVLISLTTALYTQAYFTKKEKLNSLNKQLVDIEIDLLKIIREQESFYNFDSQNTYYFKTKQSPYLKSYNNLVNDLKYKALQLPEPTENFSEHKTSLLTTLNKFDRLFNQMVLSIQKRGFKNFGIEGDMREAIHQLETIEELNITDILMLRRHEKDYILRQDPVYLEKHNIIASKLSEAIKSDEELSKIRKDTVLRTLNQYVQLFNQIAMHERMIGLRSNSGLTIRLSESAQEMFNEIEQLANITEVRKDLLLSKLNFSLYTFWIIYIVAAVIFSYFIAERLTKRLKTLGQRINYFVNTNFTARLELLPNTTRKDEIGILWNNFMKMEREIVDYLELFKQKVDEKTQELSQKNEKIEQQRNELQYEKEQSEIRNKELLDGMKYGWRIQQALIPNKSKLKKNVEKGFVFFQPKDIVSGDIYWTYKERETNESIISVIDCTGHGVPGAFMSILAVNALNYAVLNKKSSEPDKILRITNDYVFNTMKYYNNSANSYQTRDGMDMLLCKLNRKKMTLSYAAANRPLYIVRQYVDKSSEDIGLPKEKYKVNYQVGGLIFEIRPTKKTLGTLSKQQTEMFSCHNIKIQKNDMLYLTSDGFADQFGGPKNKKFMVNQMKSLMLLVHDMNEEEQQNAFRQSFLDWKAEEEQVDDITIMGVRI